MVSGIGTDILNMKRLAGLSRDLDDPFFKMTFTEAECKEAALRNNPLLYYAERFAAKEAVFKALNTSPADIRLNEIETLNDDLGRPYVNLYGHAAEVFKSAGCSRVFVSISSDEDFVTAFAVCESDNS